MAICKYFVEGRCRFGERCYNEHVVDNRYRYRDQYENQQALNSSDRYNQNENYRRDNRQDRYQENYAQNRSYNQNKYIWYSPESAYERQSSQYSSEYNNHSPRYDSSPRSPLSQNFERSPSPQYNFPSSQTYHQQPFKNDQNRQSRYDSSFSKPVQNFQNDRYESKGSGFLQTTNRYDILKDSRLGKENISERNELVELVKKDMRAWDEGNQWPFSCYLPFKSCVEFPDFTDISPEELRYEAYVAEKHNTFPAYVKSVTDAMDVVKERRKLLQNPTPETIKLIMDIFNQKSNVENNQEKAVHFGTGFSTVSKHQPPEVLFGKPTSAFGASSVGGFNLRHLADGAPQNFGKINEVQMAESSKPASMQSVFRFVLPQKASDFSFKLPGKDVVVSKPSSTDKDSSFYTPLEELNEEEKEAFEAPVFVLGKIPTRPPPSSLCL